jgi:ATP-binding cassette subfamily B protein
MDEPTSALDAAAEKAFFEGFKDTIGNRGALLISHKLSAVKYADYVYVLEHGQIIEEGSHEDLIRKEGQYAWLFDAQSSAYTTPV